MEASNASGLDAAGVTEAAREAMVLLERAADSGEPVRIAAVQDELGLGYSDARAVMGALVEKGIATEEEPGAWVAAAVEERETAGDGRVQVEVPDGAGEEEPGRDDGAAARALESLLPEPTVRLPRAAVESMDEAALGALVKSSLPSDGSWFLMEIS